MVRGGGGGLIATTHRFRSKNSVAVVKTVHYERARKGAGGYGFEFAALNKTNPGAQPPDSIVMPWFQMEPRKFVPKLF